MTRCRPTRRQARRPRPAAATSSSAPPTSPSPSLLAEIYAGALKAKGVNATTKPRIGSREIYLKALEDGSIQAIPEYTGALGFFYDKNFKETDPDKVYSAVEGLLPDTFAMLEKSAAEDNDSIVVTKETADSKSLKTIGDLKATAGQMSLGAPPEFQKRPQGVPGLASTYGVTFKSFRPLTGQGLVQALKNGQVDAANIFTTDPSIAENGFVSLEDTDKALRFAEHRPARREGQGRAGGPGARRRVEGPHHRSHLWPAQADRHRQEGRQGRGGPVPQGQQPGLTGAR